MNHMESNFLDRIAFWSGMMNLFPLDLSNLVDVTSHDTKYSPFVRSKKNVKYWTFVAILPFWVEWKIKSNLK